MAGKRPVNTHLNIQSGEQENTAFFFLDSLLRARISLDLETGLHDYDEEVNVYIAYLMMSLATSDAFLRLKPYISACDVDVRAWLEEHPGTRNEYTVYKENADYGLMAESLFLGREHSGSYHQRVLSKCDEGGRIALYYELAAGALAHLTCANVALVHVFNSIADNYEEILMLLRKAAGDYFGLMERLSEGELFHLEKEVGALMSKSEYDRRLDEFLKAYYDYTHNPTEEGRRQVLAVARVLRQMSDTFNFDEGKLGAPQ